MLSKNKSHVPLGYNVFIELILLSEPEWINDTDHWTHSLI